MYQDEFRRKLQESRREVLTKIVEELVTVMQEEGFTVEDLLEALINWCNLHFFSNKLTSSLENAAGEVCRILFLRDRS